MIYSLLFCTRRLLFMEFCWNYGVELRVYITMKMMKFWMEFLREPPRRFLMWMRHAWFMKNALKFPSEFSNDNRLHPQKLSYFEYFPIPHTPENSPADTNQFNLKVKRDFNWKFSPQWWFSIYHHADFHFI